MARPNGTPIDTNSFLSRLKAGFRIAIGQNNWMPPGEPIQPSLTPTQQEDVKGRKFDFPVGVNTRFQPLTDEQQRALNYQQLKALSNYDMVRMAINTRKDQMSRLKFKVKPRDKKKEADARCEEVEKLLRRPSGKNQSFNSWLRELVEALLIIDVVAIQPKKTVGGKTLGFELIDGALIKKVIDETGRTPDAPAVAYQQILKGVPACDFTEEELLIVHRNTSTDKIYGRSPVEDIAFTINIALRRQVTQLSYFTDSNIPAGFLTAPPEWTPEQCAEYSSFIDSLLEGNLGNRSKVVMVPGSTSFTQAKEPPLKNEFDEWLARNVCYAFSLSPQALVRENNRATAEQAALNSKEEGLGPLQEFLKTDIFDVIIEKFLGYDDLEFVWEEENVVDTLKQAQVNQIYVAAGVLTPNEIRAELGKDPLPEIEIQDTILEEDKLNTKMPDPNKQRQADRQAEEEAADNTDLTEKAEKATLKKKAYTIDRNRKAVLSNEAKLKSVYLDVFDTSKADLLTVYREQIGNKFDDIKDDETPDVIQARQTHAQMLAPVILGALTFKGASYVNKIVKPYASMVKDSVKEASKQLYDMGIETSSIVNTVRDKAIQYAEERGAALVGMKSNGVGGWIPNPNPEFSITDTTRDMLREEVVQALSQGLSPQKFADRLADVYALSEDRAMKIARTEMAWADVEGNLELYREAKVEKKKWIAEAGACEDCLANEAMGVIDMDETFADGSDGPPAHPNCKCDVIPVLEEE